MAPYITAFCHKQATPEETEVVRVLDKYYKVFIDSEIEPQIIKEKYAGSNYYFFGKDEGEWTHIDLDLIDIIPPSWVITFDLDFEVTREQYQLCRDFRDTIFSDTPNQEIIDRMYELVPAALIAEKLTVAPLKDVVKQNNEYMFSHWISTEKDICICQVDKPFTDKPFTCVIEEFSKNDFLPLFTAYYICSSWGVAPKDSIFLVHLWNHLDMRAKYGQIDLEQRLKKNIEDCQAGKPEPRVYRENIEHVKALFKLC